MSAVHCRRKGAREAAAPLVTIARLRAEPAVGSLGLEPTAAVVSHDDRGVAAIPTGRVRKIAVETARIVALW
jgi:hypothetical protein